MKNKQSLTRCPWLNLSNPLYVKYHDKEWGRPIKKDQKHFEILSLEIAQAGLSWEIILKKRESYKKAFHNFSIKEVERFDSKKIKSLMKNESIIRNQLKIESIINNAKAVLKIQNEFKTFNNYIWSFTNHKVIKNNFKSIKDYPSKTQLSEIISKDLKKRNFRFIGATIIYSYLQASGIINDHSIDCYFRNSKN